MRCPSCKQVVDPRSPLRPFCSQRCKLVDLGRWLDGTYALPGETESEEDAPDEPPENGNERARRH